MINQKTLRSILPGKICRTVMLISDHSGQKPLFELKRFYNSPVYAELECEESKLWWMSPEQLSTVAK